MLLPTALAVNEITPSNLRAIGMMPLVFVFPALGVWWVIQKNLDADCSARINVAICSAGSSLSAAC